MSTRRVPGSGGEPPPLRRSVEFLIRNGTVVTDASVFPADLVLVDLDAEWELRTADLLTRNKLSPFVGRRFKGRVVRTIVRGVTVYCDGEIVAPAEHGREVRPTRQESTAAGS